jgi:sugar/nucleoside kinase (ribokinase family)
MSDRYDVAGIGNAIVDVIFPATDQFLLEHGIAKSVMTLIDEFRAALLLVAADNAKQASGGSAANTMAGLASFGAAGLFIGKVKNDPLGRSFEEDMREIGVHFDTPMARDAPTACSIIAVTPDGHRSMNLISALPRARQTMSIRTIGNANILYVGYLWDGETPKAAIRKRSRQPGRGRKVAFTLSDPFCVGRFYPNFYLMKTDIDILFANEEEAKALFEVDTFGEALRGAQDWNGLAALTRSEKGCVIADEAGEVHVLEPEPVSSVIDTTGAGDQFAAGFLYGLSRGRDMRSCARLGAIAAAEVISHYGARPDVSLKALAAKAGLR